MFQNFHSICASSCIIIQCIRCQLIICHLFKEINSCPKSSNLADYDGGSYDGTSKRALTDAIKAESIGSTVEEVHCSGEKIRCLSSSSVRDGRVPSVSEGAEQGNSSISIIQNISVISFYA